MLVFEIVLILHVMIILSLANYLSKPLQQKDQHIASAMNMILCVKRLLRNFRDEECEPIMDFIIVYCIQRDF